ncbi:hypothetical protein AZE42_10120 [Rhizopogon vesiculosus]|uniref:Uncharacterized protein n=1 Tax=Rhizopogon vesiculosus TaxID=180088 RepID=A0A1J8QW59_9AGAM|nr:hypothetical protein AZE42_10120 [Rhizopogon vesiculosus]
MLDPTGSPTLRSNPCAWNPTPRCSPNRTAPTQAALSNRPATSLPVSKLHIRAVEPIDPPPSSTPSADISTHLMSPDDNSSTTP